MAGCSPLAFICPGIDERGGDEGVEMAEGNGETEGDEEKNDEGGKKF